MLCEVRFGERVVTYSLEYKNVKNINLRITSDGKVKVSASRQVPKDFIESFVKSRESFILNALEKYETLGRLPQCQYRSETQLKADVLELCRKAFPYFEARGVNYPTIRFRKMVSRWGSCNPTKGIVTFNLNLTYAPFECVEYVVLHEFVHFLQANHSDRFYAELEKVCPDWKERRKMLKNIKLRS